MQIQPDASYDKKTRGKKSGVIECNSFYCGDSVLGNENSLGSERVLYEEVTTLWSGDG